MMLSIIMITVPERANSFNELRKKVQSQIDYCKEFHPTLGQVEIVKVETPKFKDGGGSIGHKRQLGLLASKGEYVCWLDDDDNISPDYVETLLRLSNKGADVCTFSSFCKFDGFWMLVDMNLNTRYDEQAKPGIIKRRPYHICAWRRSMIAEIVFPDTNVDEDTGFISEALKLARTQVHSDNILHEYRRIEKSLAVETWTV